MKIIGLTGQSGSGKGAASAIFERYGIPTVDTDAVYHDILTRRDACTNELSQAFGTEILDENGFVDRKKLAAAVFGKKETPSLLHTLNTITHKYIMAETRCLLQKFEAEGARAAIIDAPQLFEAGAHLMCDLVVGVLAKQDLRISRIVTRDHITPENARKRIEAQKDDEFFRQNCHAVLDNDGDLAALEQQIRGFLIKFEVGLS